MNNGGGKLYFIIVGTAIGVPSAIVGFSVLFGVIDQVMAYMSTWGLISSGIISTYVVYRIREKLRKDRELYEEIWWYHEEHPRVTYYRIMKQFGINIDKADKILEDVKRKKRQGWVSPFEKPPEQR